MTFHYYLLQIIILKRSVGPWGKLPDKLKMFGQEVSEKIFNESIILFSNSIYFGFNDFDLCIQLCQEVLVKKNLKKSKRIFEKNQKLLLLEKENKYTRIQGGEYNPQFDFKLERSILWRSYYIVDLYFKSFKRLYRF